MAVSDFTRVRRPGSVRRFAAPAVALDELKAMREAYRAYASDRTRSQTNRVMASVFVVELDFLIDNMGAAVSGAERRRA